MPRRVTLTIKHTIIACATMVCLDVDSTMRAKARQATDNFTH
jgi:hypothetical protein